MTDLTTYNVVIGERLQDGFDPQSVQQSLAQLAKIPIEKAAAMLQGKRTLKRNLDRQTAEQYKARLEKIGLMVTLEKQDDNPGGISSGLSIMPIEEPKRTEAEPEPALLAATTGAVLRISAPSPQRDAVTDPAPEPADVDSDDGEPRLTPVSLAAAAGAAVAGALLWQLIAVQFGYEFGLLAWGIGGVIGFAAVATGSRGMATAMFCATLALTSIIGGKYMIASGLQDVVTAEFMQGDLQQEMRGYYDEASMTASAYAEQVYDEESLRQFMVDYGFSEALSPEDVSAEEIIYFESESKAELTFLAYNEPSFEAWLEHTVSSSLGDMSPWEIMMEDIGFIDLLFLIFGVSTAFRLGRIGAIR